MRAAVALLVLALGAGGPAMGQVPIPAVACTGNMGPQPASIPKDNKVEADIPKTAASQLAMYLFNGGMTPTPSGKYIFKANMLLGPRGWKCQSVQGQAIAILPPDTRDISEGIVYVSLVGDSGFEDTNRKPMLVDSDVSPWANAYFPEQMKKAVLAEHWPQRGVHPPTDLSFHRYAADRLSYWAPLRVAFPWYDSTMQYYYQENFIASYITPANHWGVGDEILFGFGRGWFGWGDFGYPYNGHQMPPGAPINVPIQGYLDFSSDTDIEISLFAVAINKEASALLPYILGYGQKLYGIP